MIIVGLILADKPDEELTVLEISERAGFELQWTRSVLQRMATNGWLSDRRQLGGRLEGPRRFYHPTPRGLIALRDICELAQSLDTYQRWLPATFPETPNVECDGESDGESDGVSVGAHGVVSDEGPDNDPSNSTGDRRRVRPVTSGTPGTRRQQHRERGPDVPVTEVIT